MTRAIAAAALAGLLAGCAAAPEGPEPARVAHEQTIRPECYTVDLFTPAPIETAGEEVPERYAAYLGRWGGGAWDGEWCHDLHVLKVSEDGRATVVETHAPYAPWGKVATAYRRNGRIGEDGRLRLNYGPTRVEYWVEDGALYGVRRESGDRERLIALSLESET
jgi:hypothetical protein